MMVCGTGGGSISSTEGIRDVILPPTQVIIEKLAEQIEFSHLAQSLRDRINLITDLQNGITQVNSLVVDETNILAQELLALKNDLTGAVAYINEQTQVSIGQRESMVNSINTLMAQYGTSIAALEEQSTVLAEASGALMAEKTVKTDLAGNVSGYGLSAYVDPQGNATSDFQVRADTFSIAPPAVYSATPPAGGFNGKVWIDTSAGNTPKWYNSTTGTWQTTPVKGAVPFIVKTTAETIDGTVIPAGVYIDSAYITKLSADKIDAQSLSIGWNQVSGENRPADGATRNLYRGMWAENTAFQIGDIVADLHGNSWACIANHVSSATSSVPILPDTANSNWTLAVKKGAEGQGQVKGIAFTRSTATSVAVPTGGTYDSPTPITLNWSDGIPSGSEPLWMATRIFTTDSEAPQQSVWTTPQKVSELGQGTSVQFSVDGSTNWHNSPATNDIYMRTGTSTDGGKSWTYSGSVKIKGEQGIPGSTGPTGSQGPRGAAFATSSSASATDSVFMSASGLGSAIDGDQLMLSNSTGSTIYTRKNGIWSNSTVLKVNGDAIISGTLSVSTLSTSKAIIAPIGAYSGTSVSVSAGEATITLTTSSPVTTPIWSWAMEPPAGTVPSVMWYFNTSTTCTFKIRVVSFNGAAYTGTIPTLKIWMF